MISTTLKRSLALVFGLIGLLLLSAIGFAAWNRTFLQRAMSYPAATEITSSDWYSPMAKVQGNFTTPLPTADSTTIDPAALQTLSDYFEKNNSSAFVVLHQGKILAEKYWRGASAESTSNSMSMAKTIIGLLIGKAIEEGKIESEEDAAAKYLKEWEKDERANITIKDLLFMQSGLRNEDDAGDPTSDLLWMYIGDDVVESALAIPAEIAPATVYDYNNADTQVLGILLERVTGMPIEQYASEKLWQPIGAKDAAWWLDSEEGMPKVFCCYFSRARDWLRLGKLVMQKGVWDGKRVISEAWINKMLVPSDLEQDYGYHIWLGFEDGGLKQKERNEMYLSDVITIDGRNKQQVFIVPAEDLLIVRIGESPAAWDEGLVVNTLLRGLKK